MAGARFGASFASFHSFTATPSVRAGSVLKAHDPQVTK
jgi:hypothetical protein